MSDEPLILRSPFNGGTIVVPPEWSADLVHELLRRGFKRISGKLPPKPELLTADRVELRTS